MMAMSQWRFRKAAVGSTLWSGLGCMLAADLGMAVRASEPVQCSVRAGRDADWLRLDALVRSEGAFAVAGQYRFSVVKQNAAGSSQTMQSGSFELVSSGEQILTTLLLEKAAEGHYRAQLTLTRDDGSVLCVSP